MWNFKKYFDFIVLDRLLLYIRPVKADMCVHAEMQIDYSNTEIEYMFNGLVWYIYWMGWV